MSRLTTEELRGKAIALTLLASQNNSKIIDTGNTLESVQANSLLVTNQIALAQVFATLYAAEARNPIR